MSTSGETPTRAEISEDKVSAIRTAARRELLAIMPLAAVTRLVPWLLLGALGTLNTYVNNYSWLLISQDRMDAIKDTRDTFDFIVVGGGSAGAVMANRLSEMYEVLLLEAGGIPNPLQSIPALVNPLSGQANLDWKYVTTRQKHSCLGMIGQRAKWPQGKNLGGSSNLNYMIYHRGHPADYDRWANITGDPSWSYENVLQYFKKSEDYKGQWSNESDHHSKGGELRVQTTPYNTMGDRFVKAGMEFGYKHKDLNSDADGGGFTRADTTTSNGRGWSTYKGFLQPIKDRATLHTYKYSHVTKVLLEDNGNRARGVEYVRHGKTLQAFAKKEVILSAGTMSSPQILMLSGIGPREHLESFNIPVHKDLPVGRNLQDHVASIIGPFITPPEINKKESIRESVQEYITHGTGLLSSGGVQALASIVLNTSATASKTTPDILYLFVTSGPNTLGIPQMAKSTNSPLALVEKFWGKVKVPFLLIPNIAVQPHSKGEARLQSTSPFVPLLFNPNYLADERDVAILVEGAKRVVEIIEKSKAFQGTRLLDEPYPGCEGERFRSDEYWACFHRQLTVPGNHQVGTCSMGRADSAQAVVDSKLKVIGVENLRVVDASVIPTKPFGNPNAPIIMIAEKTADVIKDAWAGKSSSL